MKLLALPCYCATVRQTARAVTAIYEEALAGCGVPVTQYTLMQVLKAAPGLLTTEIADLVGIDQTTATRTLALMKKGKLIVNATGADRRERRWRLTALGETVFRKVQPKWESAQESVERRLGRAEAASLKTASFQAASELSSR